VPKEFPNELFSLMGKECFGSSVAPDLSVAFFLVVWLKRKKEKQQKVVYAV